jgi:hypothetical protein
MSSPLLYQVGGFLASTHEGKLDRSETQVGLELGMDAAGGTWGAEILTGLGARGSTMEGLGGG